MATTSLLPTVKTTLVTLLAAHANLSGVTVDRHAPREVFPKELVHIAPTATGSQAYATMRAGRKTRDEDFTVTVVFDVLQPDKTPQDAEARAMEMYAALQDVIADDPTLGITGSTFRCGLGDYRIMADWADLGAAAHLEADVDATCRLS